MALMFSLAAMVVFLLIYGQEEIVGALASNLGYRSLLAGVQVSVREPLVQQCVNKTTVALSSEWADQARHYYEVALNQQPQSRPALIGMGLVDCLITSDKSVTRWWRALPDTRGAIGGRNGFYLSLGYYLDGNLQRAASALKHVPNGWHYFLKQANRFLSQGNLDTGVSWAEIAFSAAPRQETAQQLADYYLRLGRREAAVQTWQHLVDVSPERTSDLWWAIGEIARLRGDFETASAAYMQGAALVSEPYSFYERIGIMERDTGNWVEALKWFKEAIQVRPDYQYGYLFAGDMAARLGERSEAQDYYLQAQSLAPRDENVDIHMGLLAMEAEQYEISISHFEEAIAKNPKSAIAHYYAANALHMNQENMKAIWELEKALRLSSHPSWWILLGKWYEEVGMSEKAVEAKVRGGSVSPNASSPQSQSAGDSVNESVVPAQAK